MWIRRSDLEIRQLLAEKETKKKSLKGPLLAGAGASLFAMIVYYLGYRGGSLRLGVAYSTTPGFNWDTLGAGVFVGTFTFLFSRYHQKKYGTLAQTNEHLQRCDICKEISPVNDAMRCECGGNLEPSDYFTWEEDESQLATG